jgi:hypothetical protein
MKLLDRLIQKRVEGSKFVEYAYDAAIPMRRRCLLTLSSDKSLASLLSRRVCASLSSHSGGLPLASARHHRFILPQVALSMAMVGAVVIGGCSLLTEADDSIVFS